MHRKIKLLTELDRTLSTSVNILLVVLFGVMLSLAITQVVLRYFFNNSILWADVASRHLVIWVGFLGATMATRENKHFHIDAVSRLLKEQYRRWLHAATNLFASVVCYFLAQASVMFLQIESESTTFLDIPAIYVEIIIPICFYMMTIQFVIRTFSGFTGLISSSTQVEGDVPRA